jgi:mercuric ion transport protein
MSQFTRVDTVTEYKSHAESEARGNEMRATGATLLTGAGFLAAFGAASCCALPLGLASVGLGSAWLIPLAVLTVPHQSHLVLLAVGCLIVGGILLWRRGTVVCANRTFCARPAIRAMTMVALTLGAVLVALGYMFVD